MICVKCNRELLETEFDEKSIDEYLPQYHEHRNPFYKHCITCYRLKIISRMNPKLAKGARELWGLPDSMI